MLYDVNLTARTKYINAPLIILLRRFISSSSSSVVLSYTARDKIRRRIHKYIIIIWYTAFKYYTRSYSLHKFVCAFQIYIKNTCGYLYSMHCVQCTYYNIERNNWISDYIVDMSTMCAAQGKQIDNISDIGMIIKYHILFWPGHMFSCYTIVRMRWGWVYNSTERIRTINGLHAYLSGIS